MTEAKGIFQSDIIIRTAVMEALARIRRDPRLFDHIFRSLAEDDLTKDQYGEKEIASARRWFMGEGSNSPADIPVFMSYRVDAGKLPCISISLQESTEAENTHGDVHYVTVEDTEADWPLLAGPFAPEAYAPSSGMMVIPADKLGSNVLTPGMWLLDRTGGQHQILEVLDDRTVAIQEGVVADFSETRLKPAKSRLVTTIESVNMRETYQIGVHVQGEPAFLTYLHSIVKFALLHFKQELLEARGFERSSISSSEFRRNDMFGNEMVFSRGVTVNGYVRQSWPKNTTERIQSLTGQMVFGYQGSSDEVVIQEVSQDIDALSFVEELAE